MKRPLVSIITLTYNHELFISQCLDSVLKQSYSNWEMTIVDDFSTDKTRNIISKYVKKDKRINKIFHNKRWGINNLTKSYNQALNNTKGNLIAILEGDDFWPKDKLENQIKTLRNKEVVSYGDSIITNSNGIGVKVYSYKFNRFQLQNKPIGKILELFKSHNFSLIPVTVMINKKALVKIGGFQHDKYYPFADIPTILKLSLTGKFSYSSKILGYYRKHEDSSWFYFAVNSDAMGKTKISKCVNNFILKNRNNKICKNIIKTDIISELNVYQKTKLRIKSILSQKFNRMAFNNSFIYYPYFYIDYIIYKIRHYENRN